MALFSTRTWDDWIDEYAQAHRHPVNRVCHTVGIPLITAAVLLAVVAGIAGMARLLWLAGALFVGGWIFQFVGHAFERKPPEFFKDWRFLFVGMRWWLKRVVPIRSQGPSSTAPRTGERRIP